MSATLTKRYEETGFREETADARPPQILPEAIHREEKQSEFGEGLPAFPGVP